MTYLLQEAAEEMLEFDIFYIRAAEDIDNFAMLSVTETVNRSSENLPVNGVNNRNSSYLDRTKRLCEEELQNLWATMKKIGFFASPGWGCVQIP
ncbi:MAG: hypothetical protein GY799_20165 [Desulfobulbaceae bacterium]|nr:hypothetical protein [Desulfobulbaceae bacterium]